jgi:hypothetical protein
MAEIRTWESMRVQIHGQLERQSGGTVADWNQRIATEAGADARADEPALRRWLTEQGVTGYPQMLLVWETFGYPDFLLASANELLDAQYADRPDLRPIFDAVIAAATSFGEISIEARKTYVSLVTPRRTFAIVQATTRKRIDVGLRLGDVEPERRLLLAKSLGNDSITRRVALESIDDLDDEALGWIRQAYEASAP